MAYQKRIEGISSRERITWLKSMSRTPELLDLGFDPEELSFVHPGLAITCWEGAARVLGSADYVVINVASELDTPCNVKLPIEPWQGVVTTERQLDRIADVIEEQLEGTDETKVVVHCVMGIERSALAVAWFLWKHLGYGSLTTAYEAISAKRPIVADRSSWVGQKLQSV